jgi:UDP:flavonoid glycosyltransferase YjiC (YdhE family)
VLFVSAPLLGHAFPLVPLAQAVEAAGHEVMIATAGDALQVGRSGLTTSDLAPGFAFGRLAAATMLRHPLVARHELAGTGGTRGVGLLFGAVNDRLSGALHALLAQWRPELVVHEPLAVAGAVAAAKAGIPAVLHENSLFDGPSLVKATARRPLPSPAATISIAPPSVLPGRTGWPMRAVPYAGGATAPDWLMKPAARPRIVVSRSTVPGPGSGLMRAVVAAAAGVEADVILVRPDRRLGQLPDNVQGVGWVSIPAVLATCAGIVHHGGAGTALAALDAGVPQLIVNGAGDRRHNGKVVADRGAGLAADERDLSAALLTRLVTDRRLASAASEVSAEMRAMPASSELVPRLVALG